jgi:serine/threonine-protein kinase
MSPEQVQGLQVDGRSDQFSLGVIAYEILTGRRPFPAESLATLILKIVTETPLSPDTLNPSLDPSVSRVFEKVFAKDPSARYPSCAAFVKDLTRAVEASRNWRPAVGTESSASTSPVAAPEAAPPPAPDAPAAAPTVAPPPAAATTVQKPPQAASPAASDPPAFATEAEPVEKSSKGKLLLIAATVVIAAGAIIAWTQLSGGGSGPDVAEAPAAQEANPAATPPEPAAPPPVAPVEAATASSPPAEQSAPEPDPPRPAPPKPAEPAEPVVQEHEVLLSTTPPGATIVLNNNSELTCVTPCPLTLETGRHSMVAKLAGYRDALKIFEVPDELEVATALEAMAGSLALRSNPPGAAIQVNGQMRPEKTPTLIDLPAGSHEVVLTLEGFPAYTDTLEIRDRVVSNLEVDWQ